MNKPSSPLTGMRGFMVVWFGQFVSMLGTGMTGFALSYWIFEQTDSATALTISVFCFVAPSIILSPLAGVLVDRLNRKLVIILADLAAGIVTIIWLVILSVGDLQLWQIYLGNIVTGAFNALQFPAFSAAVTLMIPKKHFGRATGLLDFAWAASSILAPVFAGALLGLIGLAGIMAIDVVTFIIAIFAVVIVSIPKLPAESPPEGSVKLSLWQDSLYGFRYIRARPGLLGLLIVFTFLNFINAFGMTLMIPMILARTGNNAALLATTQSIAAFGGVAGGIIMGAWGGPKKKVLGVLWGMSLESILGPVVMGLARGVVGWSLGGFMTQLFLPIINGSSQAIWQAKVPPAVQGRVFATRRMIAQISFPVALLAAGPLADRVFEPAMNGGILEGIFGPLVGTGPGSGMSLMILFSGILSALVGLGGYMVPSIRNVETILPDFEAESAKITAEDLAV